MRVENYAFIGVLITIIIAIIVNVVLPLSVLIALVWVFVKYAL